MDRPTVSVLRAHLAKSIDFEAVMWHVSMPAIPHYGVRGQSNLRPTLRGAVVLPARDVGASMYLLANARNAGQLGPVVWPPLCWRKAISPSISGVSIGGISVVPRSF